MSTHDFYTETLNKPKPRTISRNEQKRRKKHRKKSSNILNRQYRKAGASTNSTMTKTRSRNRLWAGLTPADHHHIRKNNPKTHDVPDGWKVIKKYKI